VALLTPAVLAAGNANKAIAAELAIAEETFKAHVSNILGKLGGNDRTTRRCWLCAVELSTSRTSVGAAVGLAAD